MPSLFTTFKESVLRLVSKLMPGLLRFADRVHETVETARGSHADCDCAERVACHSAKPHPNPRGPLKKYIEHHHGRYRVRITHFGVRNTYGPYKSLLAAVTARNRILCGWDMEIPD